MKSCPACGKSVSEYISKCPNCGTDLKEGIATKPTEKSIAIREKTHAHLKIYLVCSLALSLVIGTLIPFVLHYYFKWGIMSSIYDVLVNGMALFYSVSVIIKFQLFKQATKQERKGILIIGGIAFGTAVLLFLFITYLFFNAMYSSNMPLIARRLTFQPLNLFTAILFGLVWLCITVQGCYLLKLKNKL